MDLSNEQQNDKKILRSNEGINRAPYMYTCEKIPNINSMPVKQLKELGWCNFYAILLNSGINPVYYGDQNFWESRFMHQVQLQLDQLSKYNCHALCIYMEPLLDGGMTYAEILEYAINNKQSAVVVAMLNDMFRSYEPVLTYRATELLNKLT